MGGLAFIIYTLLSAAAPPLVLREVEDQSLVEFVNGFESVAELAGLESPVWVRVLRLRRSGECGDKPSTCPKEKLFIGVTETGEYPERKLFLLPEAYGWEFVQWKSVPRTADADHFVVLHLREKVPSSDPVHGWWAHRVVELSVNPWRGAIREVASDSDIASQPRR